MDSSVWMISTPMTVPAIVNLPPIERGAAEDDGEDRVELDEQPRRVGVGGADVRAVEDARDAGEQSRSWRRR